MEDVEERISQLAAECVALRIAPYDERRVSERLWDAALDFQERVAELESQVGKLRAKATINSSNSSPPPSSDKPADRARAAKQRRERRRNGSAAAILHEPDIPPRADAERHKDLGGASVELPYLLLFVGHNPPGDIVGIRVVIPVLWRTVHEHLPDRLHVPEVGPLRLDELCDRDGAILVDQLLHRSQRVDALRESRQQRRVDGVLGTAVRQVLAALDAAVDQGRDRRVRGDLAGRSVVLDAVST